MQNLCFLLGVRPKGWYWRGEVDDRCRSGPSCGLLFACDFRVSVLTSDCAKVCRKPLGPEPLINVMVWTGNNLWTWETEEGRASAELDEALAIYVVVALRKKVHVVLG